MILVDKVTKKYKSKKVLDDVSFSVEGGEFVSIVGPSGAGKTTLIHAMIGGESIDKGTIKVDQYDVKALSVSKIQEYRRRVGIIFQDFKLLPKQTVFENVAFALEVYGYDKKFINKRTSEVLKITGIEGVRNNFPHQLSGGEKQRTAIARALVHAPELLIADEPTGNLDPDNALALADLFKKINKHGTTVILSTHNKEIVNAIMKRVITLKEGKVVSDKQNSSYK
ncbi:cell division ATP-binding protein FtsE [Patescibacteria group bacterium]